MQGVSEVMTIGFRVSCKGLGFRVPFKGDDYFSLLPSKDEARIAGCLRGDDYRV